MTGEKDGILAIVPVDKERQFGIPYNPNPDMVKIPCERCTHLGWIGPIQLDMKQRNPAIPILCAICLVDIVREEEIQPMFVPLSNQ